MARFTEKLISQSRTGTIMIKQKLTAFLAGMLMATFACADNLALKEGHPDTYTVKKGDTLWDISGVFLQKPWYWPKIWQVNPQVKDPHWIYPGDVLNLVYIDGQPRLVTGVKKLSPGIRTSGAQDAVKSIDIESIKPFLVSDYIFPNAESVDSLPYVLGDNSNNKAMVDVSVVYVKGNLQEGEQYGIYSSPKKYKDPITGEVLGYRAALSGVGVADAQREGATPVTLVKTVKEVKQGERVIPLASVEGYDAYYYPKPATVPEAYILENVIDTRYVGKNQVVVINKGTATGVSNGDVFEIYKEGVKISGASADSVSYVDLGSAKDRLVSAMSQYSNLPSTTVGHVMVFKAYDKLSLGIVLDATDFIPNGSKLISPRD